MHGEAGKIEALPTGFTRMIRTRELNGLVSPLEGRAQEEFLRSSG